MSKYIHRCQYDQIIVEHDVLYWKYESPDHSQQVNYCPICGWSLTLYELMLEQNPCDGI